MNVPSLLFLCVAGLVLTCTWQWLGAWREYRRRQHKRAGRSPYWLARAYAPRIYEHTCPFDSSCGDVRETHTQHNPSRDS